ncbi:hypothetical protein Acr_29g0007010 [Actinidia rufa]|uniref:Reverse transcriptase domain-containing protein n=1 Tax=Actinidia rufa TaxID=165716 RepID=A0A7J0HEP8_9ERIC|nr:hypothetical protein Acr_29g0007010 [Actinidia rufa]
MMKANTKEDKSAKLAEKVSEKGKEPEATESEMGGEKTETSRAGTSKASHMEWVTKKSKAGRAQANGQEDKAKNRPLWDNLRRFSSSIEMPWMLLGDFNNVLSNDEKANGLLVTSYETRDFRNCCYDTGISDLRSLGVFLTWSNNSVWSKLDRAMVNKKWVHEGLTAQANFDFPGKKLKAAKDPLRDLNKKQFSHIAARTEAAEDDLIQAQLQLHDSQGTIIFKSKDFMEAVKEFFSSGHIFKQINHSILALIPKTKDANRVENFKPIACCNVLYKVISKIIASRLAPTLSSIVDPAQSAFIQNRSMIDNIFLLQELLRQYRRKRASPRCILNVDLRKAFDSIDWVFLQELLSALHFPPRFVGWVMECVTTTSFSLSYNGSMHGFFKGQRGLRQGDPLSPYLFVLCLEYLSRGLGQLKDNADFNFHPKCGGLKITHLAFADDLVLFSRGDPKSVSMLMEHLNHFGDCSGLKVSFAKSSLFAAGINSSDMEAIKDITKFSQGSFPFRYFGIPVADSRLRISQYSPLIDKITNYISAWARAYLSYAGRTELVKSVLQGVECFWLSILSIPAGVKAKIIQLCRNFLWSVNYNSHKRPLVAWEEDIQAKKDSIWVQWVHQIYMNNRSFWEYNCKHGDSPLIKQIISLRDKIIAAEDNAEGAIQRINQWTSNGDFQSKKAYDYFRPRRAKLAWPKMVWHSVITPKHSFILWLGLKEKLLTRDKLQDFIEDLECPLCRSEAENN